MKNVLNIVRVDIVEDTDDGSDIVIRSFYLLNPDMKKLAQIREKILGRFDNDGNVTNGIHDIVDVERLLNENFTLIDVRVFPILL